MKRSTATKRHDGKCEISSIHHRKGKSNAIVYGGIDLAKRIVSAPDLNATAASGPANSLIAATAWPDDADWLAADGAPGGAPKGNV